MLTRRGWRRGVAIVMTVLVASTALTGLVTPPAGAAGPNPSMRYVPLAVPCRSVNTVAGAGPISTATPRMFSISGSTPVAGQGGTAGGCGVPLGAGAVEVSITAVSPTGNGFLRVSTPGVSVPTATFLNFTTGRSTTNAGTVPIQSGVVGGIGLVDLTVATFGTSSNVVIDVLGYFLSVDTPAPNAAGYVALPKPCRAVNTSASPAGRLGNGAAGTRDVQIAGTGAAFTAQGGPADGCGIPTGAVAAELMITVVAPTGNGFLRAGPATGAALQGTLINYADATSTSNAAAVGLNPAATLDLRVSNFGTSTHVVVDVLGYFAVGTGTTYRTITPCRIANTGIVGTRIGPGGGRAWRVAGLAPVRFQAQGSTAAEGCGIPARAVAVELAVSAVTPDGTGQLRVARMGDDTTAPLVSYSTGRSTTNTAKVALALAGTEDLVVRNDGPPVGIVADAFGYFEPLPTAPLAPEAIGTGLASSCALTGTSVRCWGANSNGELGDGSTLTRRAPDRTTLDDADALTVGDRHACALTSRFGFLRCWGDNASGQIGDGTTTDRTRPILVQQPNLAGLSRDVIDVSAGGSHTCAVRRDGSVTCWGANESRQLGDGTLTARSSPVLVQGVTNAVQVAAGNRHTCALLRSGAVSCWGINTRSQLGDLSILARTAPVTVAALSGAVSIEAGSDHTCAVLNDGEVRCWGDNASGQIGVGTSGGFAPQATAPTGLGRAASVSAGGTHTCALLLDASTMCWGSDSGGQLGDGGITTQKLPKAVTTLRRAVLVSAGVVHTCAVRGDVVQTKCWGANGSGQSGGFTTPIVRFPDNVPLTSDLVEVVAGDNHTCALSFDGTAGCTGFNGGGQLGNGNQNTSLVLVPVQGLTGAVSLTAGGNHTCALLLDRTVSCWGDNSQGQLGDGTFTNRLTAARVPGVEGVTAIAAGLAHTCAVSTIGLANSEVRCWGDNSQGQLGNATTVDSTTPVLVPDMKGTLDIDAGTLHTCVARGTLGVSCWGANTDGQLGNSSTTSSSSPVPVTGLTTVVSGGPASLGVSTGAGHTCALLADASTRCWGGNAKNQLNDGTTTTRTAPVSPGGSTSVVGLGTGAAHTCAAKANGTVTCFGANSTGQSGAPVITINGVVVATVTGLTTIVALTTGANHNCAIRANGGVRCWGNSLDGQAGTGVAEILTTVGTGLGRP